jgi:hypothetical protein
MHIVMRRKKVEVHCLNSTEVYRHFSCRSFFKSLHTRTNIQTKHAISFDPPNTSHSEHLFRPRESISSTHTSCLLTIPPAQFSTPPKGNTTARLRIPTSPSPHLTHAHVPIRHSPTSASPSHELPNQIPRHSRMWLSDLESILRPTIVAWLGML